MEISGKVKITTMEGGSFQKERVDRHFCVCFEIFRVWSIIRIAEKGKGEG